MTKKRHLKLIKNDQALVTNVDENNLKINTSDVAKILVNLDPNVLMKSILIGLGSYIIMKIGTKKGD